MGPRKRVITMESHAPRILLAEDNRDFRELLSFCLFRAGYSVTCCDNGLQLLEALTSEPGRADSEYDLVLTDLRMPALTGLEVLETYHDCPRRPPFVCMTAFGDTETHELATRLGAVRTIDKPVDLDDLISLIDGLLSHGKKNQKHIEEECYDCQKS